MTALERYRKLEDDLALVRWLHLGLPSQQEDEILDKMDGAWWALTDGERALIDGEPPRSLIRDPGQRPTRILVDVDVEKEPGSPVRRLTDPVG